MSQILLQTFGAHLILLNNITESGTQDRRAIQSMGRFIGDNDYKMILMSAIN